MFRLEQVVIRGALAVACSVSCSCSTAPSTKSPTHHPDERSARAPAQGPASDPSSPCGKRSLLVELTPPSDDDRARGRVAVVYAALAGPGTGSEWTCLIYGGEKRLIQGSFSVETRADASELQRLSIGTTPILVHLFPRRRLRILYHPCMGWVLDGSWLDDGSLHENSVTRTPGEECPSGFLDAGEVHEAEASACPDAHANDDCRLRRCVREARLEFAGPAGSALSLGDDTQRGETITLDGGISAERRMAPYGGICPAWTVVDTGSEKVRIAPGVGERWLLRLDERGRLSGAIRSELMPTD